MRTAVACLALALVAPSTLSPDSSGRRPWTKEDLEATQLVEALEKAPRAERTAIVEKIVERRLPQTIPALSVLLSHEEIRTVHDRFCPRNHLLGPLGELCEDPFEQTVCLAAFQTFSTGDHSELKRRGCCRMVDDGASRLEEFGRSAEAWTSVTALLRLWKDGATSCIPSLLSWSSRQVLLQFPWLGPVVRWLLKEFSCESICDGIRWGDRQAMKAAAHLHHRAAVEAVGKALAKPAAAKPDSGLRADLMWTLGEIGDRRALPILLRELQQGDYWSKPDAAEALGKLGDASVVPDLIEAVEGGTALMQAEIFLALGLLGTEEEIPLLEKYAQSTEYTGAIGRAWWAKKAIEEIRKRSR